MMKMAVYMETHTRTCEGLSKQRVDNCAEDNGVFSWSLIQPIEADWGLTVIIFSFN